MTPSWLKYKERGTAFMLRFGLWGVRNLGRRFVWLCSFPITAYFFTFSPRARQVSHLCLTRILNKKIRFYHVFHHLHTFGMTILDRVYFVTGDLSALKITLHDDVTTRHYLQQNKGALLLGSHLGCFETLRAVGLEKKISFKALMYTHLSNTMNELMHEINPVFTENIIPAQAIDSLLHVEAALRQGNLVGILGDRLISKNRSQRVSFFEKDVFFPTQPFLIAALCRKPILLFFSVYTGDNQYSIFMETLVSEKECCHWTTEEYVKNGLERYAKRLEDYTKKYPYNWFNFFDFWGEHA